MLIEEQTTLNKIIDEMDPDVEHFNCTSPQNNIDDEIARLEQ